MEIEVLGSGCAKCKQLYAEVEKAVAQTGQPATLTKVETIEGIMGYGVMMTPALVVDGRVVSSGKIPNATEIATMITTAAAKA
jgi:small redox-active disulfide protein 2